MYNLNKLSKEIHAENVDRGFYDEKRELGTLLMLVVSELSEALEADRKKRHCNIDDFSKNDLSDKNVFESLVKDTFEDEIADTLIRMFDLCGYLGIDIDRHIEAKRSYNKSRGYKHGKSY